MINIFLDGHTKMFREREREREKMITGEVKDLIHKQNMRNFFIFVSYQMKEILKNEKENSI